jgi:hypothetical protein
MDTPNTFTQEHQQYTNLRSEHWDQLTDRQCGGPDPALPESAGGRSMAMSRASATAFLRSAAAVAGSEDYS